MKVHAAGGTRRGARGAGGLARVGAGARRRPGPAGPLLCYCDAMRNITVSVPDETYRKARVRAAELDRSVSALVRDFLAGLAAEESDFDRRRRLQDEVLSSVKAFRAGDRLPREQAHDRHALR